MEIKDIIKTDADRLFIVDPECYIIFTGESKDDIQPFIRIGNWMDLPVKLIPLIENIIITDNLIGNPSHEQFNIDVRYLSTNRYIGGRSTVAKFLEFQKIFGLDLANASVVDIEKDLPLLSAEKNISQKDQFIGVFYRNGDFKVLLNKSAIFDLNEIIRNPITNHNFHDLLSEAYKKSARYDGAGLVVVGHNPIFYFKKYFYSYLFPADYFNDFSMLGIDPGNIRAILHPSPNLINISKFFKWLNLGRRSIRIFTNTSDIALVKKIFSNCTIKNEKFSPLGYKSGSGLTIKNYPGGYNLKLRFDAFPPNGKSVTAAFIKGSSGVKTVIKEKLDALIITYTAFEDINLMLKSATVPFVIVDDGNKNLARLGAGDHIILHHGLQYEFRRFGSINEVLALPALDNAALPEKRSDPEALAGLAQDALKHKGADFNHEKNLFNLLSIVQMHRTTTDDRKTSVRLKNIALELERSIRLPALIENASRFGIILAICRGSIYPVIMDHVPRPGEQSIRLFDEIARDRKDGGIEEPPQYMRNQYNRILADRDRLMKLIEIYMASEQYGGKNKSELDELARAIAARKEHYKAERLGLDHGAAHEPAPSAAAMQERKARRESKKVQAAIPVPPVPPARAHVPELKPGRRSFAAWIGSLPRYVKILVPLVILLMIAALLYLANSDRINRLLVAEKERVVQSHEIDTRFRELAKKQNIKIRDYDIMNYANRVAIKNGYHKISESKSRYKNPDWIYPDNVFIMLDGQKVTVSNGDTLWNLCKNKLIEATITFNEIMKKIKTAHGEEKAELIQRAEKYAYTAQQQEQIKKITPVTIPPPPPEPHK
jgi:hypothetical protein